MMPLAGAVNKRKKYRHSTTFYRKLKKHLNSDNIETHNVNLLKNIQENSDKLLEEHNSSTSALECNCVGEDFVEVNIIP